jgi:tripartite-type tricarboxylate transporter receptor subunit TctC
LAVLGALALGAASGGGALAQGWPARPIGLIVPFPPGGGTQEKWGAAVRDAGIRVE